MKVAITATEPNLESNVDPRFGRCPCYLVVETDDMSFEAVENPHIALGSGAGIQSAQLMVNKDVRHVLTGNCGPNAHQTLVAAGIDVIVGCSGAIRDVVEQYKAGRLTPTVEPNVASHSGMAPEAPQGPSPSSGSPPPGINTRQGGGMGSGRGMGAGRGKMGGRGMGQGRGRR